MGFHSTCQAASCGDWGLSMANGICIREDGTVVVAYRSRMITIPRAQYMANGYCPPIQKLPLTNEMTADFDRRKAQRRPGEP